MVYANKKIDWKINMVTVRNCDECKRVHPLVSKFCAKNNIKLNIIPNEEYDPKKWNFVNQIWPFFILQKNGESVLKINGYRGEFKKIERMIL